MKKIIALALGDLKHISRDAVLSMSIVAPILLAITVKFIVPWIHELVLVQLSYDLTQDYDFIMSFLVLMTPMMSGMLTGFMILEERDEDLLTYYAVTPLAKSGYMLYRMISPVVISFTLSLVLLKYTSLINLNLLELSPVVFLASLEAPIIALFMATFASNKVEGLALAKVSGLLPFAALVGYIINSNWKLLAGIIPSYWVCQAFLIKNSHSIFWLYIIIGLIVHVGYIKILLNKFNKRIN